MAHARSARLLAAFLAIALLSAACAVGEGKPPRRAESQAMDALTAFMYETLRADGDIQRAYSMLSSTSKKACDPASFERLALSARQDIGSRQLVVAALRVVSMSDDTAAVEFRATLDGRRSGFTPNYAYMTKEDGEWRYAARGPCGSLEEFFGADASPTL